VLRLVSHMTVTSLGSRADQLYSRTDKKLDVFVFGVVKPPPNKKHASLSKTSSPVCKTLIPK